MFLNKVSGYSDITMQKYIGLFFVRLNGQIQNQSKYDVAAFQPDVSLLGRDLVGFFMNFSLCGMGLI